MTIREALTRAADELRSRNIDTALLDATLLLAEALGVTREKLFVRYDDQLPGTDDVRFRTMMERRLVGEPVSYILGRKEFYGRTFHVDPRVLVPRPDTETLVEAALEQIDRCNHGNIVRVHDACTGTGAVGITLKAERGSAEVSVSDISPRALEVCRANSLELLGGSIEVFESDLLTSVPGRFDLIVANPPYLTASETQVMMRNGWPEPALALDGGGDGLDLIRRLVREAVDHLAPNGYLCIEAADAQCAEVGTLLRDAGYADVVIHCDLANRRRVTVGRWR